MRVINRSSFEVLNSVNEPDYPETDWVWDRDGHALDAVSGVAPKYWKLSGDQIVEMSQGEKDSVDAALIPGAKAALTEKLVQDTRDYINAAYATERQQSLHLILTLALVQNRPNQAGYVLQAVAWVNRVLGYHYQVLDQLTAAATLQAVDAISWDFSPFNVGVPTTGNPDISIRDAMGITN